MLWFATAKEIVVVLQKDNVISTKLKCASGLAALKDKKYKQAARKFTEVRSGVSECIELSNLQPGKLPELPSLMFKTAS